MKAVKLFQWSAAIQRQSSNERASNAVWRGVESDENQINTLAIVGVGLIGGSLSLALKAKGGRSRHRRRQSRLSRRSLRLGSSTQSSLESGQSRHHLLPRRSSNAPFSPSLRQNSVQPASSPTAAAQTRRRAAARATLGDKFKQFVPAHPIAGTEKTGAGAAFATLYEKRKIVICAEQGTDAQNVERVAAMWQATGADIHRMPAAEHDDVFAAVSHLPHFGVRAVDMLAGMPRADHFNYAASGFETSRASQLVPRNVAGHFSCC